MGQNMPQMSGVVGKLNGPRSQVRLSTGERIRILRGRARVTRPQLAQWAGVSTKSLARYVAANDDRVRAAVT